MKFGKHKTSQSEAMEIALKYAAEQGKKGQMEFLEVRSEKDSGEWLLTGTCGSDRKPTEKEKFRIVVSSEGELESADFNPSAKEEIEFSKILESINKVKPDIKSSEDKSEEKESTKKRTETGSKVKPDIKSSEDKSEEKESTKKRTETGTVFRDDLERTVKKFKSLKLAEQHLCLEREKLLKELKGKAVTLEEKIKDLKSDIKKIKVFLENQADHGQSNPDLEMQIAATEQEIEEESA
jgi:hypothetical protein